MLESAKISKKHVVHSQIGFEICVVETFENYTIFIRFLSHCRFWGTVHSRINYIKS